MAEYYASKVIKVAEGEIGVTESPKNSNKQKYGKEYGVNGTAWCCQFVWWVFKHAGASELFYGGDKTAWVPSVRKHYTKKGKWIRRGDGTPKPGDLIIFGNRDDSGSGKHIGIVTKVTSSTVYTIEGNTTKSGFSANGGMVAAKSYSRTNSNIAGYCTVDYDKESEAKTVMIELNQLEKGSKGDNVKALQILLIGYGFDCGNYGVDGDFGSATNEAVRNYQKAKGLTVDGIVGKNTWNKLLGGM